MIRVQDNSNHCPAWRKIGGSIKKGGHREQRKVSVGLEAGSTHVCIIKMPHGYLLRKSYKELLDAETLVSLLVTLPGSI